MNAISRWFTRGAEFVAATMLGSEPLHVLDAADATLVARFESPMPRLGDVAISPDGLRVAYSVGPDLFVRSLDTIGPRRIDGVEALGWRLDLDGMTHTLWVDPADNRPLRLEAELAGGIRMVSTFTFNEVLPDTLFEVPPQS